MCNQSRALAEEEFRDAYTGTAEDTPRHTNTRSTMETVDSAAPKVDLQHQQDLAGAVQSPNFLSVLIALATLLFTLGTAVLTTPTARSGFSDNICYNQFVQA